METEIWKIASWAGGSVAVIFAIGYLLRGIGFKKNGTPSGGTISELALRQIADNGVKTNVLLERLGEITTKNGDKLDKMGGSLALAMERQIEQRKVVEEIRRQQQ